MTPCHDLGKARRSAALLIALALAGAAAGSAQTPPPQPLDARLQLQFAPADGIRTRVQGVVAVPVAEAKVNTYGFYNLELAGNVTIDGRIYDHFAYRFDVPANQQGQAPFALSFARTLRPGHFRLALQVRDVQTGRVASIAQPLVVPRLEGAAAAAAGAPPATGAGADVATANVELATRPAAAAAAPEAGVRPQVHIVPPPPVVMGKQRLEAAVDGAGIVAVRFALDGHEVMRRTAPPWSVELDLGSRAVHRVLRVDALDAQGRVVASDRAELNTTGNHVVVRLARPSADEQRSGLFDAAVSVEAPPDAAVRRVEVFLDDRAVGVLEKPPYRQPISAPPGETALLRAVATLADGTTAEDSVLLNAPNADEVNVDLVELYTAVVDRGGRPVRGLRASEFHVFEDGVPQRVERFAEVANLPVHLELAIDTSTSMTLRLPQVKQAALAFLRDLVRPQDEAMLLTFDDAPHVRAGFTHDLAFLGNGLEGLRAQGGTALYDSLIFGLGQLQEVRGQRVMVLLSDGLDERSTATAREVMELARRGAVTLYTIGLEDPRPFAPQLDRALLDRLAAQTGGRSFYVDDPSQLSAAYAEIQRDMRSRYLLAYYSTHAGKRDFRTVDVELAEGRLQARTIRGYYPD